MHNLPDLNGATIAFDLDGALVDTAPDLIATLGTVLAEEGLPPLPFDAARMLIGRGARGLLERGFAAAGAPLDDERGSQLTEHFVELYLARIARESRPFPQVPETLEALRGAGARLTVCTNKRTNLAVALLETLDLARLFGAIVGPDVAGTAKPDPQHLLAAIAAVGGDPSRAVFVGDSETDVKAARNAGVPIVVVSFGYTEIPHADLGADILIDHYAELPAACGRLLLPR